MRRNVEITRRTEPTYAYELEDGNTLKVKLILHQVIDEGQRDAFGMPLYKLRYSVVSSVQIPDGEGEGRR